jgi:DNA polymerase III subunit epsilon
LNDRNKAILWAHNILEHPENYYIIDTETTGLENPEIIELGVIDLAGNEIINQRFRPTVEIEPGATAIHGLTNKTLDLEPPFYSLMEQIDQLVSERKILIYNFFFDSTAFLHTYETWNSDFAGFNGDCVMHYYSQFCGEWNEHRGNYRWQKLPGGDHSAIGDCRATLAVIKHMAKSPLGLGLMPLEDPLALETLHQA